MIHWNTSKTKKIFKQKKSIQQTLSNKKKRQQELTKQNFNVFFIQKKQDTQKLQSLKLKSKSQLFQQKNKTFAVSKINFI